MDVGDPEKVEGRKRRLKIAQNERDEWLKAVVNTYEGRAVLWELLEDSKLFHSTFSGEQPLTMAFREGRRQTGQRLYTRLLHSFPQAYSLMVEEYKQRASRTEIQEG